MKHHLLEACMSRGIPRCCSASAPTLLGHLVLLLKLFVHSCTASSEHLLLRWGLSRGEWAQSRLPTSCCFVHVQPNTSMLARQQPGSSKFGTGTSCCLGLFWCPTHTPLEGHSLRESASITPCLARSYPIWCIEFLPWDCTCTRKSLPFAITEWGPQKTWTPCRADRACRLSR